MPIGSTSCQPWPWSTYSARASNFCGAPALVGPCQLQETSPTEGDHPLELDHGRLHLVAERLGRNRFLAELDQRRRARDVRIRIDLREHKGTHVARIGCIGSRGCSRDAAVAGGVAAKRRRRCSPPGVRPRSRLPASAMAATSATRKCGVRAVDGGSHPSSIRAAGPVTAAGDRPRRLWYSPRDLRGR